MLSPTIGLMLDSSLRILSLPINMLDASPVIRDGNGLPAGTLDIAPANLILAATPCAPPLFRNSMLTACAETGRDVALVHTGLFPENVEPVTVDVALVGPDGPFLVQDLIFMRGHDNSLWLVPQQVGPFIRVRGDGLALEACAPFITLDERCDGVRRAAAEIVRLVRRRGC